MISLLRELIRLLKAEREAIPAAEEPVLAEIGSSIQRLLEDLVHNAPGDFNPAQIKELSGLMEEASRQRDQNMRLLQSLASELEGEIKQLFREQQAFRAYRFSGETDASSEALFLSREC